MFLKNNTNKQYSLRKLKKGTASVAVALAVLGAGVATSQTVKADNKKKLESSLQKEEKRFLRISDAITVLEDQTNAVLSALKQDEQVKRGLQHSY